MRKSKGLRIEAVALTMTCIAGFTALPGVVATASAAPTTTIVWYTQQTGTPMVPDLVKLFESENPGILVDAHINLGTSNVTRAIYSADLAAGSSTPDVYIEDQTWPAEAAINHWAVNLNNVIPKSYLTGIGSELLNGYTYKGELIGIPFFTDAMMLYYNKDILAKAHLPVPTTWEQLSSEAKQLQNMKLCKYGLVYFGAVTEATTMWWTSLITDAGGASVNPSGTKATVDSSAGLEAMTWLRSTVTSGITPAAVSTFGNPDPGNVFYEGSTAFLAGNAYQWPGAVAAHMQSDVGVTFDPTFPGGPPHGAAATGGAADVINPYSKHMAADIKFVEFMTSKQADEIVARVGHLAPSLTSVQDDPVVDAANPPAALLPKLTLVNRPAQEDNYPGVTQAIASNVNAVLAGTETPAGALAKMSSEINAALKSS